MRFLRLLPVIAVSAFIFSFFLPTKVDALMFQLEANSTYQPGSDSYFAAITFPSSTGYSGGDPNSKHEKITKIIVSMKAGSNNCVTDATIWHESFGFASSLNDVALSNSIFTEVEFLFSTSTSIYEDEIGYITFDSGGGGAGCTSLSQFNATYKTSAGNVYPYAHTCNGSDESDCINGLNASTDQDLFFIILTESDTNTVNPPNLDYNADFTQPICGDFQNWEIENTLTSSTRNNTAPRSVCVSTDSNAAEVGTSFSYWECSTANAGGISTLVPKDIPLNFNQYYYTQAYLCEGNVYSDLDTNLYPATSDFAPCDTIIVDSPIYSLLVTDADQCENNLSFTPSNTTTPETGSIVNACDDVSGFLGRGFCALFIPSQQIFLQFDTLRQEFATKVPMGYFTIYSDAIEGLESATSTTSSVQTVDSSFMSDLDIWATLDIIQTLKTIMSWMFWLVFIFYLYHRFKNFSLHG